MPFLNSVTKGFRNKGLSKITIVFYKKKKKYFLKTRHTYINKDFMVHHTTKKITLELNRV